MEQKDWLDELVIEKRKSFYILLSFLFFFFTTLLFMFIISKVPSRIKASERVPEIVKTLVVTDFISCFAGVAASIMSIIRHEKPTWLKMIGMTLNMLTFAFFIWLLSFWILHLR